jgi:UDP-glucose 4-epimerase
MRQALRGEPLTVFGDGMQQRCFCDVRDVVQAIVGLAHHPAALGRVFNVGSEEEISILDLAKKIKALTKSTSDIKHVPYAEAYAPGFEDMARRVPDISRVKALLGWSPRRSLNETLEAVRQHEARP